MNYEQRRVRTKRNWRKLFGRFFVLILLATVVFIGYKLLFASASVEERVKNELSFDSSVTIGEQELIKKAITTQNIALEKPVSARVVTAKQVTSKALVLQAYLPVTNYDSVIQRISAPEISASTIYVPEATDEVVRSALTSLLEATIVSAKTVDEKLSITEAEIAFIPVADLSGSLKLLELDDSYYLDAFDSGAVFREVVFEGEGAGVFAELNLNTLPTKDSVYKVNMTGVTALTRIMQRKLDAVGDPLYFSALIGEFLADADLTHVSNEVSFKSGCGYSHTVFCSPPEFIETLKASGVDLVELTGNHNNDVGSDYNTSTIELYKSLGWGTVGGGLNTAEAAKPYVTDAKGSKIAFLAYNYPDSPNGGAISGENKAGANSFDFDKIQADIATAKQSTDFVIVNVQFWECYAYPDGYVEYPICDEPIGEQEQTFKKIVDLGANMVVGSSAHQPQTYELYNGKPIYYGLGNLYFDQTSWPGTERGIILTHYFVEGKLLQTKLTPTVYGTDLQTRLMTDEEASYLLGRLHDARE